MDTGDTNQTELGGFPQLCCSRSNFIVFDLRQICPFPVPFCLGICPSKICESRGRGVGRLARRPGKRREERDGARTEEDQKRDRRGSRSVRDESGTRGQREERVRRRCLTEEACVGGTGDPAGPRGDPEVWAKALSTGAPRVTRHLQLHQTHSRKVPRGDERSFSKHGNSTTS